MALSHTQTFETKLADYFRERLQAQAKNLAQAPQDDTFWYLGQLLARLGHRDQFFTYEQGELSVRPLALLYHDALQSEGHERCLLLRQLGDMALFLGALFPERYARKGIGKDYFVGMGGGAYDYLAEHARQLRHVFEELANGFAHMLDLIAATCAKQQQFDASDILALYQRWHQSGDKFAKRQLEALGISLQGDRRPN
ncbi:hypothetical protein P2G88_18390 [Aliiglaciecola sp. CAU 1673]|uniref:hypothetical protein n=1 Tax=Aliiglaciecola sp. CAU 1673 TaxID=3032595 RepID=UPI0023D97969|nr:hypothetical protein [Aliiglaciecola sp. CAU 1673]MDF2180229.1 hypothetical protein [Aliiglaciecola sp. CAU 1673]